MSSRFDRPFLACGLTVFLLVWGAAPALANDRTADTPPAKRVVDLTIATNDVFVPTATVPERAFEGQTTQTVLTLPRTGKARGGLSGPALRRGLIVSFGALQALDAHSTIKALDAGGREANPLLSGIASNRGTLLAVKAGTAVATAYFVERLSKNHPKRAVVLMAVLNSAYVAVVAHNYRVARAGR